MNPHGACSSTTPADANLQFRKGAMAEVKKREIERILRALRRAKRNKLGEIVITSDELLRDEDLADLNEDRKKSGTPRSRPQSRGSSGADFLSREENLTEVFQGKPLVKEPRRGTGNHRDAEPARIRCRPVDEHPARFVQRT